MSFWQIILLALLQGVTEFLPISSSAHLILVPAWMGWEDQGIAFDVAVHLGSLIAVLVFSRREISAIAGESWAWLVHRVAPGPAARLGMMILLASLPVGILGLLLHDTVEASFRDPKLIAVAGALFAILMVWADRRPQQVTRVRELGWRQALMIGCGQAMALIPGAGIALRRNHYRRTGPGNGAAGGGPAFVSAGDTGHSGSGGPGDAKPGCGAAYRRLGRNGVGCGGGGRRGLRVHGRAAAPGGPLGPVAVRALPPGPVGSDPAVTPPGNEGVPPSLGTRASRPPWERGRPALPGNEGVPPSLGARASRPRGGRDALLPSRMPCFPAGGAAIAYTHFRRAPKKRPSTH